MKAQEHPRRGAAWGLVGSFAVAVAACGDIRQDFVDAGLDAAAGDGAGPDAAGPDATEAPDASLDAGPDAPPAMHAATVTLAGTGGGTVTSSPTGITCPGTCSASYVDGQVVTLTASPDGQSLFTGWSGACTGSGACTVTMDQARSVTATFTLQSHGITVTRLGNGAGTVTSSPGGIACGTDCSEAYAAGTVVSLTAAASTGSTFTGWSGGGCTGTGSCVVTVTAALAISATFTLDQYTLTVDRTGTGTGSVASSPAGVACPGACTATFNHGQQVTLTATASTPGSVFGGWSGGGCTGTGTCTVTLTGNTTVNAAFDPAQYTLTIARPDNGVGTVTSSPAGINCGGTCSAPFTYNQTVTLTAVAATSPLSAVSTFTGWSGGGCTGTGTCTVTITGPTTVTAGFALEPNVAFVTASSHTGNLGGLAGADAICAQRAAAVNLPGTYRAWLSTPTISALSRLGSASGWIRTDGKPLVDTTADLAAGRMYHPLRFHERVGDVGAIEVHTATTANGTFNVGGTSCSDYTSAASASFRGGSSDGVSSVFTTWFSGDCSETARLYCFGVDRAATVRPVPPASYRRAFVSATAWTPGGGIAAADTHCQTEAAAAGLPGTYRALLASINTATGAGLTAASRFNTSGPPWGRPDGVLLAPTATELFSNQGFWDSALTVTAAGAPQSGNLAVWSGAATLTTAGSSATTCAGWTSTTSTGSGGRSGFTQLSTAIGFDAGTACNVTHIRLRCLQQ